MFTLTFRVRDQVLEYSNVSYCTLDDWGNWVFEYVRYEEGQRITSRGQLDAKKYQLVKVVPQEIA